MTRRLTIGALVLIFLVALAPLISALTSGMIAYGLGCRLDEGSIHQCTLFGTDIGHALYTMFVLGWLSVLTIPCGILALIVWVLVGLLWQLARRRWLG